MSKVERLELRNKGRGLNTEEVDLGKASEHKPGEENAWLSPGTQGGLSVTLAPFSPCRPSGPGVPAGP